MKNKISKLLISMGLLIIIGSLMLISYSKYVDNKALQSFEEKIEKKEVISKVNPGDEIGIIEIESVNLKNVIELHILELPKFKILSKEKLNNKQLWMLYLNEKDEKKIKEIIKKSAKIKKLDKLLNNYWRDEKIE